jgi:hypothetical protein
MLLTDADNDVTSDDDSGDVNSKGERLDAKKRRKMERPRKRKRENQDDDDADSPLSDLGAGSTPSSSSAKRREGERKNDRQGGARPTSTNTNRVPSPEDLSLRSAASLTSLPGASVGGESVETAGQKSSSSVNSANHVLSSPVLQTAGRDTPSGSHYWSVPSNNTSDNHSNATSSSLHSTPNYVSTATPNAVKELEAVMNRHLPQLMDQGHPQQPDATSAHSARLGRGGNTYPAHAASKKSTIQWVGSGGQESGGQSSSGHNTTPGSSSDGLTTSGFLRSLYESRESVIRSCNSSSGLGGLGGKSGSCVGGGSEACGAGGEMGGALRGNGQLYGGEDMTGDSLLTPPGGGGLGGGGGEHSHPQHAVHPPTPFSIPSIVISTASHHHTNSSPSPVMSSTSSKPGFSGMVGRGAYGGPLSLALPCGGGGGGGGVGDAFSMTPPSSVSPQDMMASPFAAALHVYNETSCGGGGLRHVYGTHHASSSSSSSLGVGGHGGDYASAKAAYYAMSALSQGVAHHQHHSLAHGGYGDVNHNTTYDQCARPVIPWY